MTITAPAATPILPPYILPVLIDLAECVCTKLAEEGAGRTCWCGIWPGAEVSWEYCGECAGDACGMGWVRLMAVFPYDTFPVASIDLRCSRPLAYQVEIGALRCLPQPAEGTVVDPAVMTEVALSVAADTWALYRAAECCEASDKAIVGYLPLGPSGGCVGGSWSIFLAVD